MSIMDRYIISAESTAGDLIPICMAFHEMLGRLPVTGRSRLFPGIRIEEGAVVDHAYTGPILEEVIKMNVIRKITPDTGNYKGVPVIVAPIRNSIGEAIAAVGLVDITGIFDLATLMEHQSAIIKQVCGKDPCPLPAEQSASKR